MISAFPTDVADLTRVTMTEKPLIIAFDGPAASGKGTLATVIAGDYGLPFLDTGLLYRAVGHLAFHNDVPLHDPLALSELARNPKRGDEVGLLGAEV